jgi:hypothetical protein
VVIRYETRISGNEVDEMVRCRGMIGDGFKRYLRVTGD